MAGIVSRSAWINLYKQLQREAEKLGQYNHREFAHRRIRDYFEEYKTVVDPAKQQELLKEGEEALALIKRQAVIEQVRLKVVSCIHIARHSLRRLKSIPQIHLNSILTNLPFRMKECSKCRSNEYTNKALVMLINECAHPLCKNCVDNLYARNAAPCHVCGRILKKNTFWEQVFDDSLIEKENNIRKQLRKIYNLKEDDFEDLQQFNDYLERFEMIVWNLTNDLDVAETKKEIDEFKELNGEHIERNKKRLDADQLWVKEQLKEEKEQKRRIHEAQIADSRIVADKIAAVKETKAIMDELRDSKLPAEMILDRQRKRHIEAALEQKEEAERKKRQQKDSAASRKRNADQISFAVGGWNTRGGGQGNADGRAYTYTSPVLPVNGPPLPQIEELELLGYLAHMRGSREDALAGGYIAAVGAARALYEARVDLLAF